MTHDMLPKLKTVMLLLLVIALNIAALIQLNQLNIFINTDLYNYGLIFNIAWYREVTNYNLWTMAVLIGATNLTAIATIPHYLISRGESNRFLKLIGSLWPAAAMACQGISIYFLNHMDLTVRNTLYDYGIPSSFNWNTTFNPIIMTTYALMTASLIALIIPAVRSLEIIKIEIIQEEDYMQ
jgi:hypothetical protein